MRKKLSPLQAKVLRLANDGWTLIARGNLVYANDERIAARATVDNLTVVDAKMLIEFIAVSSNLNVEFRKHKKRQLSEETKAKLAERLRGMRQQQTA